MELAFHVILQIVKLAVPPMFAKLAFLGSPFSMEPVFFVMSLSVKHAILQTCARLAIQAIL